MKKDTGLPKSAPRLHEKFLMDLGATSTCLPGNIQGQHHEQYTRLARFLMDLVATSACLARLVI